MLVMMMMVMVMMIRVAKVIDAGSLCLITSWGHGLLLSDLIHLIFLLCQSHDRGVQKLLLVPEENRDFSILMLKTIVCCKLSEQIWMGWTVAKRRVQNQTFHCNSLQIILIGQLLQKYGSVHLQKARFGMILVCTWSGSFDWAMSGNS